MKFLKIGQNNKNYYGYKNQVKVDEDSKIIVSYHVTSAEVHASQVIDYLV